MWKVEVRKTCKVCGKPLTKERHRTFCSTHCRYKFYNKKYRVQQREWQRSQWGKPPEVEGTKVQCPICDRWYVQLATHVIQRHEYDNAREFREDMGWDVKRGTVPDWYRELKAEITKDNGTIKNLKKGKKYWFIKGDKTAGKYERSKQTLERLRQQGLKIGRRYGGRGGDKR